MEAWQVSHKRARTGSRSLSILLRRGQGEQNSTNGFASRLQRALLLDFILCEHRNTSVTRKQLLHIESVLYSSLVYRCSRVKSAVRFCASQDDVVLLGH